MVITVGKHQNVTCNDILAIYLNGTAHRCAGGLKKKVNLRSGSQCHRHFVGFLTCPFKHRHGATLFIRLFRETAPFSRLLRPLGIRRTHSRLKHPPRVLKGAGQSKKLLQNTFPYLCYTRDLARKNQKYKNECLKLYCCVIYA